MTITQPNFWYEPDFWVVYIEKTKRIESAICVKNSCELCREGFASAYQDKDSERIIKL